MIHPDLCSHRFVCITAKERVRNPPVISLNADAVSRGWKYIMLRMDWKSVASMGLLRTGGKFFCLSCELVGGALKE